MQKREKILLGVLGAVVVVAVIVLVVVSQGSSSEDLEQASPEAPEQKIAEKTIATLDSAERVLRSDKFLTLTTFGKVPVTVSPDELGKSTIF